MSFIGFSQLRSDERGVGLLFGLFAAAVVAAVAWTMVTSGLIDTAISDNYRNHSTAFYAADAGVEESLIDFRSDRDWIDLLVDLESGSLASLGTTTISVNGFDIEVELDDDGQIVPNYYAMGPATTIGDGTYQREVYLPPSVFVGDCEVADDGNGGSADSGSKDSKSKDSKSKDSKSKDSKSKSSGSGSSGGGNADSDDPCSTLASLDDDSDSGSKDSNSEDSNSKDSKSKDSKSKDSSSNDSGSGESGAYAAFFSPASAPANLLLATMGLSSQAPKVTICHVPPGNPDAAQTITIGAAAVSSHMENHPDSYGECGADGGTGNNDQVGNNETVIVMLKVRSTGTAAGDASSRILADLIFNVSNNGDILDIQVANWREAH